jgi:DNA-binding NarL/FixJ family response regulator
MLSAQENRSAVEGALRSGAAGYVVKTACSKELMEAIDVVRDGRSYLSPSVAHHLVNAISHPGDSGSGGAASLTARERQVVQLIAEGLSSKEIAAHLGVSHKTVESHRASVMEKLDIHKASALVRYAIREGLVAL